MHYAVCTVSVESREPDAYLSKVHTYLGRYAKETDIRIHPSVHPMKEANSMRLDHSGC